MSKRGLRLCAWAGLIAVGLQGAGCKDEKPAAPEGGSRAATAPAGLTLPEVDVSQLALPLQMKLAAARREVSMNPDSVERMVELGALAYVNGFPQLAVACLSRAVQLDPNETNWLYCLGLAQQRAGSDVEAQATFEKFAALRPDWRPVRMRLLALRCERDPGGAAEELRRGLESEPNSPPLHAGLGFCALASGKLEEALEHFRTALKHGPRYGPAHAGLARALKALGRSSEVAEHTQQAGSDTRLRPLADPIEFALRQQGLDVKALQESAERWAAQQKFDRTEKLARQGLEIDEGNAELRVLLGDALARQGRAAEAIQELERLLRRPETKDHAGAKVSLAFAHLLQKNLDEAERVLDEVLAREPANVPALRRLTDVAVQREPRPKQKVLAALDAALAAAPGNAKLLVDVAEQLHKLGETERERAALRRAIERQEDLAPAWYALGVLEFTQGNREEARRAWNTAVKLEPKSLEIRHGLIALLTEERDFAGLERALRDALRELPDSPDLQNRLAWLLATCVDAKLRNPAEALTWAEKAAAGTKYTDHVILDTLAAACAAQGKFEDARKWIAEAVRLAQGSGDLQALREYQARQARYQQDQPLQP